jgi:fission 1 protein
LLEILEISQSYRRECLYYISIGYFRLKEYSTSKEFVKLLLEMEPYSLQAQELKKLIEERIFKEGLLGVGIISGIVIITAGILGKIISNQKK